MLRLRPVAFLGNFNDALGLVQQQAINADSVWPELAVPMVAAREIHHHDEAERLLAVSRMSESWRRWADDVLHKAKGRPTDTADPGCC